jgi:hypothetical protein
MHVLSGCGLDQIELLLCGDVSFFGDPVPVLPPTGSGDGGGNDC